MARGEWGHNGRCSYRRATLVVCSVNVVVAVYVLRSLYASLYMYPIGDTQSSKKLFNFVFYWVFLLALLLILIILRHCCVILLGMSVSWLGFWEFRVLRVVIEPSGLVV